MICTELANLSIDSHAYARRSSIDSALSTTSYRGRSITVDDADSDSDCECETTSYRGAPSGKKKCGKLAASSVVRCAFSGALPADDLDDLGFGEDSSTTSSPRDVITTPEDKDALRLIDQVCLARELLRHNDSQLMQSLLKKPRKDKDTKAFCRGVRMTFGPELLVNAVRSLQGKHAERERRRERTLAGRSAPTGATSTPVAVLVPGAACAESAETSPALANVLAPPLTKEQAEAEARLSPALPCPQEASMRRPHAACSIA